MGVTDRDGKDRATGKTVLLFSGGMDSLMVAWLAKPDVLLYVRHGSRYEQAEASALTRLVAAEALPPGSLLHIDTLPLGRFERPDAIIPLRNLFFVALAAQYGERVLVGAMQGDRSLDKSAEFFQRTSDLLSYLHGPQHWCQPRTFFVNAPYQRETKTSLVRRYLAVGHDPALLRMSFSCYDPVESRQCGVCKPCFRKWVALRNNGIDTGGDFAAEPRSAPWLRDVWQKVLDGTYRTPQEDTEWQSAVAREGGLL